MKIKEGGVMDIQIRDVKPFEQYCIDEFSMCHDDGDFERDVLGFYESIETERLWRVWELQAAKAQAVPDTYTPIVLALEDVQSKIAKTSFLTMDGENENEVMAVDANELAAYIDELIEAQEPAK